MDPVESRLKLAREMGASHTFIPESGNEVVIRIHDANEGYPVDVVLEMSGFAEAITNAFQTIRNRGSVTLFWIPSRPVEIDIAENMIFKNLKVFALNGRLIWDTWYKTRWLLESKVVYLRPVISREITFDQIEEAMELLASDQACKLVLRPDRAVDRSIIESRETRKEEPDARSLFIHG